MHQEEMESSKSRAGRDWPFCHTHPTPHFSNSSHSCHCRHAGLCANPAPTRHPLGTLLFSATPPPPRQDLPPHFFRLSSNAAIPFTAFPYRPRYVKWYYLVPFACCKTPYFCFTLPHTIRFTFRHLLTVCLPPLQSKTPKDRGFPSIHCCSPSTCD